VGTERTEVYELSKSDLVPAIGRARILVIDDEELVLRTLARMLRDYEVVALRSARDAVALLGRGECFELILSDVTMPVMNGVQFYEALLGLNPDLAKHIVFLYGGALSADIDAFLATIPNVRIHKPFTVTTLLDTVQQQLRVSRRPVELSA
jgi:CheY-like chemotaxis protein